MIKTKYFVFANQPWGHITIGYSPPNLFCYYYITPLHWLYSIKESIPFFYVTNNDLQQ